MVSPMGKLPARGRWLRSLPAGLPLLGLLLLWGCPPSVRSAEAPPSFRKQIGPLLQFRCLRCHSGARPKGDLDLTTAKTLHEGGASGSVIKPGKAANSLLFQHVRDKKMPPKKPLAAAEVVVL